MAKYNRVSFVNRNLFGFHNIDVSFYLKASLIHWSTERAKLQRRTAKVYERQHAVDFLKYAQIATAGSTLHLPIVFNVTVTHMFGCLSLVLSFSFCPYLSFFLLASEHCYELVRIRSGAITLCYDIIRAYGDRPYVGMV